MQLPYKFNAQTIIDQRQISRVAVNEIKNWLATTDLPEMPEEMIVLFLLACQSVIDAQECIKAYFRIKNSAPEIFKDRNIDRVELQDAMKVVTCCALPRRLENNIAIHLFNLKDTNYKNFDLISNMKLTYMLNDLTQNEDPPNKVIIVIDMKGRKTKSRNRFRHRCFSNIQSTVKHLTRVKLGAVKKFIHYMQDAMPLSIDRIHVLNADFVFEKALAIAKLFMKSNLVQLIEAHKLSMDTEEFQKMYIPATHLPQDYGGELPNCEELNKITIQQFREIREFFEAEERLVFG